MAKRAQPNIEVAAFIDTGAAALAVALDAGPLLAVAVGPVGLALVWVAVAVPFVVLLPYGEVELVPVVVLNW